MLCVLAGSGTWEEARGSAPEVSTSRTQEREGPWGVEHGLWENARGISSGFWLEEGPGNDTSCVVKFSYGFVQCGGR